MSTLHRKSDSCGDPGRIGDIIFVHGIGGHYERTWRPARRPGDYWPAWLGQDMQNIGVWSLEYEAPVWGPAMSLLDQADNVIAQALKPNGIGKRPIIFITHSLGGLVVKQILRRASDTRRKDAKAEAIFEQTRGIVFLATPHVGSGLANWIKCLFSQTSVLVDDLKANNPHLRDLNDWYRNNLAENIPALEYRESWRTKHMWVVNATSANVGQPGLGAIPLPADHLTICKPESKDSPLYIQVKEFIVQCLAEVNALPSPTLPPSQLDITTNHILRQWKVPADLACLCVVFQPETASQHLLQTVIGEGEDGTNALNVLDGLVTGMETGFSSDRWPDRGWQRLDIGWKLWSFDRKVGVKSRVELVIRYDGSGYLFCAGVGARHSGRRPATATIVGGGTKAFPSCRPAILSCA
jgi:pimeloyl-ACP methyl ester carboxylesterase